MDAYGLERALATATHRAAGAVCPTRAVIHCAAIPGGSSCTAVPGSSRFAAQRRIAASVVGRAPRSTL